MHLKKITLYNFRQFYGKQEILFSDDPNKNVTMIHAENGVGKTTLLNALLWCFYNKNNLTARFESPDKIVSNQAIEEDDFEASVEVWFEHNNNEYLVSRKINEKFSEEYFEANSIENGNFVKLQNPAVFVESVIPKEMSRYFFFDGEYAESFSSKKNKSVVRAAVESMLGCNTAIQATSDLEAIKKALEKEIAGLTKDNQSELLQKQIDKLEKLTESEEAEIIVLEQNLEVTETAINEIQEKLRNSEGAQDIQLERERLENEKKLKCLSTNFFNKLKEKIPNLEIIGSKEYRHPGNLNIRFPGINAQDFLQTMQPYIAASTGSACNSGNEEPSYVLDAIGLTAVAAAECIRFSFGVDQSKEEIIKATEKIFIAHQKLEPITNYL